MLDYIIGPEMVWKGGDVKRLVVAQGVSDFIGSDHRLVYAELELRAGSGEMGSGCAWRRGAFGS